MKGTGTPDKRSLIQRGVEALGGAFPIIGPNGKMMGNLTSLQGQPNAVPAPEPSPRLTREDNIPSGAALDPVPEAVADRVPLPRARPTEAGAGASDISAQSKKPAAADALGDFSKSLAGIKPIQPAPVNPVGTPSVRAPHATGAPNIQSLLQMIGQQNSPTVLSTLGRLLVAGKA